jgi:hypothetical protein
MTSNRDVIDLDTVESLEGHPTLHQKVLLKAAELADSAVRLKPPFDRIVNTKLWPRTRYTSLEGLDAEEKEILLQAMVASAKFSMCGEAFRDQERFRWLRAFDDSRRDATKFLRDTAEFAKYPPREPDLRAEPIIIDVMKRRRPDFKHDNQLLKRIGRTVKGVVCFTKPFTRSNRLLIVIGYSSIFEIRIGIETPLFAIRDGCLWATSGSWRYHDAESCRQTTGDVLDVVDIVISPFAEKMAEALG